MAYNPYNDINAIYENKKKYNEAKLGGQNYAAYADAAQKYYTNLSNNGYADIADKLAKSTEEQAADLMRQYTNITAKTDGSAPVFNTATQTGAVTSGITPDITNWVSNIVGAKGQYNEALARQSGAEGEIAKAAQEYYNLLTGAGRKDIGDLLASADYTSALNYLNSIKNASSASSPDTQAALTQLNQLVGSDSGSRVDYDKYKQNAQDTLNYMQSLLQPSAQDAAAQTQTQNNLQALFNAFTGNNAQYNAQSQDVLNQISQYATDQSGRYDDLYKYQKDTNPFDTDTARAIMNYYNMLGGNAAGDAVASGGGDNAGNIDSYAAANANRQQLAFTNAGTSAVNQNYNDKINNMLNTLRSLGIDVGDAQSRQIDLVQGNQAYNTNLLGNYTTGAGDLGANITARQTSRDNVLADALAQITGLQQTDSANASNEYAQRLQAALGAYDIGSSADATRESTASDLARQYLLNQQNRENLASNERLAEADNERMRYLAELEVERDKYIAQGDWSNAIDIQRLINEGSANVAGTNAAAARYDADTTYKIAQLNAEAAKAAQSGQDANSLEMTAADFLELYEQKLLERTGAAGPTRLPLSTLQKEAWNDIEEFAKTMDAEMKARTGLASSYYYNLYKIARDQVEEAAKKEAEAALVYERPEDN